MNNEQKEAIVKGLGFVLIGFLLFSGVRLASWAWPKEKGYLMVCIEDYRGKHDCTKYEKYLQKMEKTK